MLKDPVLAGKLMRRGRVGVSPTVCTYVRRGCVCMRACVRACAFHVTFITKIISCLFPEYNIIILMAFST